MTFSSQAHLSLNGSWQMLHGEEELSITSWEEFQAASTKHLPAAVPGNFELDLFAAGEIADPFVGMTMKELYALETHHVWYAREFEVEIKKQQLLFLKLEGSDCFAEYYLNGQFVGESENALVEHEFAVGHLLRNGRNELIVHFRPAYLEAKKYDYPASLEAFNTNYEALHVRKAPHSYGWDIMPRTLSVGLWRDVSIVWKAKERLEELYLETLGISDEKAQLRLFFRGNFVSRLSTYEIEISGQGSQTSFHRKERVFFEAGQIVFHVESPQLWWPRGRGEAHLYDVTVRLLKDGQEIDQVQFKHGIRSIRLERTSTTNEQGEGEFCFWVNGEKIFILGNNHVPLDAYHSRDLSHTRPYFDMLEELGCNMLRCWGGNVYESDLFYDLCDEKGILVWQDFAMACAAYPQDAGFQEKFAAEVTKVVKRLRQHPCIALWAGDNECDSSGHRRRRATDNPNHNIVTRQTLPGVLRQHDPGREYLPSSPYIDEEGYQTTLDYISEQHPWGPRDYYKNEYYSKNLCHFASEMGYHGCPSPESIRKFITPENVWPPHNDEWLLHTSSPYPGYDQYDYRVPLMAKQIFDVFGTQPETLEEFARQSQFVQAEAKEFFIELFRTAKWRRTGIIWWNLRDGWPQTSDAVVDYYGVKKLAYKYIKRAQQPLLVTFREPENGTLELVACNDRREEISLAYRVRNVATGVLVKEGVVCAQGDAVTPLAVVPYDENGQCLYGIEWESSLGVAKNHYLAGKPPFNPQQYWEWCQKAYS
jgi:Beta-galactosidase/beta-glucuronidase